MISLSLICQLPRIEKGGNFLSKFNETPINPIWHQVTHFYANIFLINILTRVFHRLFYR